MCVPSLSISPQISPQIPKMSSATVGMFEPCDLIFGCFSLGDGVTHGKRPIFAYLSPLSPSKLEFQVFDGFKKFLSVVKFQIIFHI
jgi:hypothetical protein